MATILGFLSTLHVVIVIALIARILLREDVSGPARLAWFIVVITTPFLGAAAYLLLGEIQLSERLRSRHRAAFHALKRHRADVFDGSHSFDGLPENVARPFRFSQSINGFAPTHGNRGALLPDAATFHDQLIAEIDAARDSVHLLFYIWLTDETGTEIAEALIRAAGRGVTCRAGADNLGSRGLVKSDLWERMGAAGVEMQIAMPLSRWFGIGLITRGDLRNHRKLTIIDGKTAFVGSKNAADPAFAPKAKYGPWIDIMLRIEGPVVNQAQALFASDWMLGTETQPEAFSFDAQPDAEGFIAQFRGTGPLERRYSTSQMFCTLFEQARSELVITTPYFVPDAPVLSALQSAALRGVEVILILPRVNDSWIVQAASRGHYNALLNAGVRIFEHIPGLLHSKIVTVDGETTLMGSSNLDLRSFDLNFENDMLFYDLTLTAQVRARQDSYLEQSVPVSLEDIRARSLLKRLRDNVVATMGPVL